jgi:hypothetical protein
MRTPLWMVMMELVVVYSEAAVLLGLYDWRDWGNPWTEHGVSGPDLDRTAPKQETLMPSITSRCSVDSFKLHLYLLYWKYSTIPNRYEVNNHHCMIQQSSKTDEIKDIWQCCYKHRHWEASNEIQNDHQWCQWKTVTAYMGVESWWYEWFQ